MQAAAKIPKMQKHWNSRLRVPLHLGGAISDRYRGTCST